MTDSNTIVFRMGEETGIVIEKTEEQFERSIFIDQYRKAYEIIGNIMKVDLKDGDDMSVSNIVAFCGDRGEGKTSCMRTVMGLMTDVDVAEAAQNALNIHPNIYANKNFALEMLDPSFFDEKHNIVELVLGQLYERVIQDNKKSKEKNYPHEIGYQTMMSKFAEAQSCLSALAKKEDMFDSMNELSSLAASIRLRKALRDLFKAFLDYKEKQKLFICIDDLDVNMTEAYPMAENIRKYFCNEYCVVLMAVKIDQLSNAIQNAIRSDIKYADIVSNEQIVEMANKYLIKFIPENNRIQMPSPENIVEKILLVLDYDGRFMDSVPTNTVKETIVRQIFNKTRYLFYNSRSTSPIVPHNLRDIRQLVGILVEMRDIYNGIDPRLEDVLQENKKTFRNYFFQAWISNLNEKDKTFARQLAIYDDIISVNKFVVTYLGQRILNGKETTIDALFDTIIKQENRSHNISVGDVYYVIRQIDAITTDNEVKLLLFFVRSYYSMRLYELYDEITTIDAMSTDLSGRKTSTNTVQIYKYDSLYEGTNKLQRFLNGSYFTYTPGELLNDRNEDKDNPNLHRDAKVINGLKLGELLIELNKAFKSKQEKADKDGVAPEYDNKFVQDVRRCEYFILTTTYQLSDKKISKNRAAVDPPFIGEYANIKLKYIAFDFLAVFYNLVNMRYAFARFGAEGIQFYQYVFNNSWSLVSQLLLKVTDDEDLPNITQPNIPKSSYHKLLSDACIRVSEVQQSIVEELTKNKKSNKHKDGSNTGKIRLAYQDIQELEISLYPYYDESTEKLYKIPFDFLTPIMDFLKAENEEDFNSIFMLEATIDPEKKKEFDAIFPKARNSGARKRANIITALRKDQPNLPTNRDPFWMPIFSDAIYSSKNDWLELCINNLDKLKQYINKKK